LPLPVSATAPAAVVAAVAVAVAVAVVAEVVEVAVIKMNPCYCNMQSRVLLQFHITGRCNLRCKHCYRTEGNVEPLSYEDIISVMEQFKELRKHYNRKHAIKKRGHINLTGGEPFIRKDIKQILSYMGENREHFSYGILSNGSFLDDELITLLKNTNVAFVQLSLDGKQETHDELRAPGDYERVLSTAKRLEKSGIKTYISFTANQKNFRDLPYIAKECRKRRITKLWSDRIVPIGNGEDFKELTITADLFQKYVKTLKKAQGNWFTKLLYPKTQVTMNRALQFLYSKGSYYCCSAGNSLITVDEFGNIMPCRRMPILCGNIKDSTLRDIYENHEVFKDLRIEQIPSECSLCQYAIWCRGGAKCQSYAAYHSYKKRDPACPLS